MRGAVAVVPRARPRELRVELGSVRAHEVLGHRLATRSPRSRCAASCAWNVSPWSMPQIAVDRSARQCPPLRSALLITTSNAAKRRNSSRCVLEQREVVLVGVVLDEALHHAEAVRSVAQHRVGHDLPAERVARPRTPRPRAGTACRRGSPTAAARRAAACRPRASRIVGAPGDEQRRVRRPRASARATSIVPVAQQHSGVRAAQFHRGQM